MKTSHILQSSFIIAFTLLLGPEGASAQGNLVLNGDFEAGSQGWTFLRGARVVLGGVPSSGLTAILASTNASPAAEPTASQSLAGLLPGSMYLVSGDYQPGKDRGGASPTNASFGVAFNGAYVFELVGTPGEPWEHFSFSYTATSTTELLSLTSQIHGTGVEYEIDNISVVAIPEPGSLSLLTVGVLLLASGSFRSRERGSGS